MVAGSSIQNVDYSNKSLNTVQNDKYATNLRFLKYGIFGQANRKFFQEKFGASLGLRADGNTYTQDGNKWWRTLSPRISGSYLLNRTSRWTVNASVGRYYKIPPYTVLGYMNAQGVHTNSNVKYIQSDHFVVGIEHLLTRSSRISVESFLKLYTDYPVSIRDSVSLANKGAGYEVLGNEPVKTIGMGKTYGVEVLYQQKFTGSLYAILAYTLYWSEFSGINNNFLPSLWDNRHLLTFTGGYKLSRNWELGIRNQIHWQKSLRSGR